MTETSTRILLVEDNAGDARLIGEMLREHEKGEEFTITHTGRLSEALKCPCVNFDVVLLDLGLPDSQGMETLDKISTYCPQHPIIVLTGLADDGMSQQALRRGAQDYLVKGKFDSEVLLRSIRYALERKWAEEAMRESEDKYRLLVTQSPDGIFTVDLQGKFVAVNKAMCDELNYTEDELLSMKIWDIVPKVYVDGHQKRVKAILAGNAPNEAMEYRVIAKDGTTRHVEVLSTPQFQGTEVIGFQAIARDISERKRAEEKLRQSEAYYRTLTEASPDALAIVDPTGHVAFVSPKANEMFGVPPEESQIGMPVLNWVSPGDHAFIMSRFQAIILGQVKPEPREFRLLKHDGSPFWGEINSSAILDQDGKTVGLLMVCRDISDRKRAEVAVRKSEARFHSVWERSNDGMRLTDEAGKIVDANDAYCQLVTMSRDQLVGKALSIVYKGQGPNEGIGVYHERFASGNIVPRISVQIKLWNDEELDVEISNSFIEIPQVEKMLLSIFRDISDQKRAERALAREQFLMSTLMDNSPDHIYFKDTESRFIRVNKALAMQFGLNDPAEAIGKTDFDFFTEEHALLAREDEQEIIRSGKPLVNVEEKETWPDGRETWVSTTKLPLCDTDGRTIGTFGISRDITKRKQAEESLRASEEKFRALFEESKDFVYITIPEGKFLDINAAGVEMLGYASKEELLRINLNRDLYAEDHDRCRLLRLLEEHGFVKDVELVLKRKNGEKITVLETATAPRNADGKVTLIRGTIRDVTKQRLLERQVTQAQKMESLGLLAGGIAHDFNNILGIILGHAAVVERTGNNSEMMKDSVEEITKAVQRGANLVRQILTFARKTDATVEPVHVNATARELAKMIGDTFPKTIHVSLDLEKSLPIIMMDPTQLHQALLNLCVNARDAIVDSSKGNLGRGEIAIATRVVKTEDLRKTFPEASAPEYVCLSVADSGVGMDEETKLKIFEPFFTTKQKGKGTGLGLSVVYGIVKSHHGHIDVESSIGAGTTFHIYLPITDAPPAPAEQVGEQAGQNYGGKETILFVEDEENLLHLMKATLEREGYSVLTATDGMAAIRMFSLNKDKIALVLTDLGLPKLDGAAVFTSMRDIDPNVKIILASGYLDANLKSNLLRSGAKEFIQKPYSPTLVLKKIREVLDAAP